MTHCRKSNKSCSESGISSPPSQRHAGLRNGPCAVDLWWARLPVFAILDFDAVNPELIANSDEQSGKEGSRIETRSDTLLATNFCCRGSHEKMAGWSGLNSTLASRVGKGLYSPFSSVVIATSREQGSVMEIEIIVIGESSRWVLNQPRIRIGRDAKCEVSLPGGRYPSVAGEHVTLDVTNGSVKLLAVGGGQTFLNDNPAGEGFVVRSGDVLRLGAGGPELRIRLSEPSRTSPSGYQATRVMQEPGSIPHEATRVMSAETTRVLPEATRVMSPSTATVVSPAPAAGSIGRQGYSSESVPRIPVNNAVPPRTTPLPAPRHPDFSANAVGGPAGPPPGQSRVQDFRQQPISQTQPSPLGRSADDEDMQMLESKLKGMRVILLINTAILVALIGWIFQLNQQLTQTRQDLKDLRVQAQTAVGQFTPSLDARLAVFEKRMDGIDGKMRAAQEQMVAGMDAKMKSTEDRLVERMNAEIPAMLDKYINKKLADVKH
jgi:predicted component of type VI protein secretion system